MEIDSATKWIGREWAGPIPATWDVPVLRQVARVFAGGTPDRSIARYWESGAIPWLSSGEVNQWLIESPTTYITEDGMANSSATWIPSGSIVIALAGQGRTKGMVAQLAFSATCNQSLAAIIPSSRVHARYLLWWLAAHYETLRNLAGGEQRDGLNLEIVGNVPCPLPPLATQTAIAGFLDVETGNIDRVIGSRIAQLRLLRTRQQAEIDAVTGWAGKMCSLKRLAPFVTSGPRGWADRVAPSGIPFIRIGNLQRDSIRLDLTDVVHVDPADSGETGRSRVHHGDVLVSITADIGTVGVAGDDIEGASVSQHVAIVRPQNCLSRWLAFVLRSTPVRDQLQAAQYGGTKQQLALDDLRELRIPLADNVTQVAVADRLMRAADCYDSADAKIREIIRLLQERRRAQITAAVIGAIPIASFAA